MTDTAEIQAFLKMAAETATMFPPEGYTGSPRVHLGIGVNGLRDFLADYLEAHGDALTPDAAIPLLAELYEGNSVEEPILAGLLLARLPKVRAALSLETFGGWLDKLQGWVEVDSTCQSSFGPKDLYSRWDEWTAFLRSMNASANINQRRASLVLLNRTLRESDDPRAMTLALELIENVKAERDRLMTKAVSWVLREGTKRHKSAVAAYLDAHSAELASHVVREVRKKLETGKRQ